MGDPRSHHNLIMIELTPMKEAIERKTMSLRFLARLNTLHRKKTIACRELQSFPQSFVVPGNLHMP